MLVREWRFVCRALAMHRMDLKIKGIVRHRIHSHRDKMNSANIVFMLPCLPRGPRISSDP